MILLVYFSSSFYTLTGILGLFHESGFKWKAFKQTKKLFKALFVYFKQAYSYAVSDIPLKDMLIDFARIRLLNTLKEIGSEVM